MEAENFKIKDPEILLEKLTALTSDFSKLAKDREMKEIFTQIEKLKSGLSKAAEEKENFGESSTSRKSEALMKKSEKTKKTQKTSKSLKNFEDSDDSSSPDFIINRKPDQIKKSVKDEFQSDSISLLTISKSKKAKYGESNLQLAIKAKDENLIKQLIDSKHDINHKDNNKLTALHDAVSLKDVDLAERLIKAGAKIDAFGGPSLSTPLHLAASYEDTDMVKMLLEYGADPFKKDGDGQEALNITMQIKIQKIIKKAKEKFSQKSQASGDSSILDSSGPTLEDIELPKTAKIFLFGRDPKQSLAKLKKSHGFIFVGDIKRCTHMVIESSETITFPLNYLQAILDGKWIVGPDFFKTKSEIQSILNVFNEGPKKAVLAHHEDEPPLLTGMKIFFDRGLNQDLKNQISNLVISGGAKIINREPKPDSDTIQSDSGVILANPDFQYTYIILYDGQIKSSVRRGKVASAPVDWLFKCIAHFQVLPL